MPKPVLASPLVILLLTIGLAQCHTHSNKEISSKIDNTKIMYGSTVRIKAVPYNYYMHSHSVDYPLGSGFQSVTGFNMDNDYNSLWTIKQPHNEPIKTYLEEVKCGDAIRLEHALTKKNLHSEEIFQSMITKGQEVSCFGNGGEGDENDNWVIKCLSKADDEVFFGSDVFELVHQNTEKKIKMNRAFEYSYNNWENCPFQGQIEVSAVAASTRQTQMKIVGGVFFRETQSLSKENGDNANEDL